MAWLAVAILLLLAAGTYERNKVWRDDESLWADVAAKSPRNGRGLMNYGLALMKRGRLEEALGHFERASELVPNYPVLQVNLGVAKSSLGELEVAESHFRRALELQPSYAVGHYFFARWLTQQGRAEEAIGHLETSLRLSAADLKARTLLMRLYAASGDDAALRELAEETLDITPSDPAARAYAAGGVPYPVTEETAAAYERLGLGKIGSEAWLDAAIIYQRALELNPGSATAWNNLGWARLKLGFHESAVACFGEAYELDPAMEVAANNLRWARELLSAKRASQP